MYQYVAPTRPSTPAPTTNQQVTALQQLERKGPAVKGTAISTSFRRTFKQVGKTLVANPALRRRIAHHMTSPSLFRAKHLKQLLAAVDAVLDVGVNDGTPELYRAFPDAHFYLIDAQGEIDAMLKHRPKAYSCVNVALGASVGEATLFRHALTGRSTLVSRTSLTKSEIRCTQQVPMTTLDHLIESRVVESSLGVKIDAEGSELAILEGAQAVLNRFSFVLCEASVMNRFVDGYTFSDLVSFLAKHELRFFNFLNPVKPYRNFYDVIFLRSGDPRFDGPQERPSLQ